MSTSMNIKDTITLFFNCLEYNIYRVFIFLGIVCIYIIINKKDKKIIKYILSIVNIILIILICLYYIKDIISFNFNNPFYNIYFYFFSSIIYLIIFTITLYKLKYKNIYYVLYIIIIVNILFSLFMTNYLNNNKLLILGNIYPMIIINNTLYVIYYVLLTIRGIRAIINSTFKGVK